MSEDRKKDHIDLTFKSRPEVQLDLRGLHYEPLFSPLPDKDTNNYQTNFLNFNFELPLWVSSMTGGTEKAKKINENLARACGEFKFGMGLGSCRSLLDSEKRLDDFDVKKYMDDMPLFTNFGIAQVEQLIAQNALDKILGVQDKLKADGLIIHVNPLQEWAQPEGDKINKAPIETIESFLEVTDIPVVVKEVGQGFGPRSIEALANLPLAAIEFASFGGTNFTLLEQTRHVAQDESISTPNKSFGQIGHTASEMVDFINHSDRSNWKCKNFIISGGISNTLKGHILKSRMPNDTKSVIGMASNLLKFSMGDYEILRRTIVQMKDEFELAKSFIVKEK